MYHFHIFISSSLLKNKQTNKAKTQYIYLNIIAFEI